MFDEARIGLGKFTGNGKQNKDKIDWTTVHKKNSMARVSEKKRKAR
jgi:hypothetical protein